MMCSKKRNEVFWDSKGEKFTARIKRQKKKKKKNKNNKNIEWYFEYKTIYRHRHSSFVEANMSAKYILTLSPLQQKTFCPILLSQRLTMLLQEQGRSFPGSRTTCQQEFDRSYNANTINKKIYCFNSYKH